MATHHNDDLKAHLDAMADAVRAGDEAAFWRALFEYHECCHRCCQPGVHAAGAGAANARQTAGEDAALAGLRAELNQQMTAGGSPKGAAGAGLFDPSKVAIVLQFVEMLYELWKKFRAPQPTP